MSKYFPLHVHSHYSLLDGLSKPEDIAKRCEEIGVEGSALTDHGSMSGHIQFLQKMQDADKKPLLGNELYISKDKPTKQEASNRKLSHLPVIARNDEGWRDLARLTSAANKKDHFYHKPRLDLEGVGEFASKGNLMAFSGHIGSDMANALFDENKDLSPMWRQEGGRLATWFRDTFGKDNFYLEVQLMDNDNLKVQNVIADCIRQISKDTGIPCVATPDAHYARQEDAIDQRILLCSNMHTTIQKASHPDSMMSGFFRSKQYHIPSYEEMKVWHTAEELDNTLKFAAQVEKYTKILRQPVLPNFTCPKGMNPDQYLRHLCDEGWKRKLPHINNSPTERQRYSQRLNHELSVLQGAGLSSYFLIVADIINYVRYNKWLPGPGRGSAAGCLVSYLIGITSIDPLPYGLIFERFYNAGRNTADRVSMPDIDMDVPKYAREPVIEYIRKKYGAAHVGQMVTFQTMKGRGAIKDVLRAYGGISFDEMNKITKNIIEEHKISDELQAMKKETGESSIIRWCLENTPKKLQEWCQLDEQGNLTGPLASRFEQAMRLEGTKTSQSKHAAGVVIAPEPLDQMMPLVLDTDSGQLMGGLEMEDTENVGGIKFDVLGVTALDKGMGVQSDLEFGEVREIQGASSEADIYFGVAGESYDAQGETSRGDLLYATA